MSVLEQEALELAGTGDGVSVVLLNAQSENNIYANMIAYSTDKFDARNLCIRAWLSLLQQRCCCNTHINRPDCAR